MERASARSRVPISAGQADYLRTGMVVVEAELAVPTWTTTAWSPVAAPAGTCTSMRKTPAWPGAVEAALTVAAAPPIVTCGNVASGIATDGTAPGRSAGFVA